MPPFLLPNTWEQIHARLRDGDPVAQSDLAVACLEPLLDRLRLRYPRCDPDLLLQAAHDAVLELIRKPYLFDPQKGSLAAYLFRAAVCDLKNTWRDEARHKPPALFVELDPEFGNYPGREDEPGFSLCLAEARQQAEEHEARAGLSPLETRCLRLMRQGERRTEAFIVALGLEGLSPGEQREEVERIKDRIKVRLKRAEEEHNDCA